MTNISLMKHTFFKEVDVERKLADFILNETRLSMSTNVFDFENQFANWHNRKHCVMVNSGSSANLVLLSALLNLGILSKGEKIGLSAVTWSTNVMPVIQLGLIPILIDVMPGKLNVGVENIESTSDLRAIFLTNVLGLENDIINIHRYCSENDILLLEDNCEGLGCSAGEILLGNHGLASTASSFVGHHLSTIEGGYIFTDDDKLASMCKVVRAHGWTRNLTDKELVLLDIERTNAFEQPYTFEYLGFNVRPSEINAKAGSIQLPILDKMNDIRSQRYEIFLNVIQDYIYHEGSLSVNPIFAIPLKCKTEGQKQSLIKYLRFNEIECRPIVSGSMGLQPFWKRLYGEDLLTNSSMVDKFGLYITNDPQISDEEFEYLHDKILEFFL